MKNYKNLSNIHVLKQIFDTAKMHLLEKRQY